MTTPEPQAGRVEAIARKLCWLHWYGNNIEANERDYINGAWGKFVGNAKQIIAADPATAELAPVTDESRVEAIARAIFAEFSGYKASKYGDVRSCLSETHAARRAATQIIAADPATAQLAELRALNAELREALDRLTRFWDSNRKEAQVVREDARNLLQRARGA